MLKYEYTQKVVHRYESSIAILNKMGQEGWILCSSVRHTNTITYTFRRLILT